MLIYKILKRQTFFQNSCGHDDVDFSTSEVFDGLVQLGLLFSRLMEKSSAWQSAKRKGRPVGKAATNTRNGGLVDDKGQGRSNLTFLNENDGAGGRFLQVGVLEEAEQMLGLRGREGIELDIVRHPDSLELIVQETATNE